MSDLAIQAFVAALTELPVDQVIWTNQPGPRRPRPWISLLTIDDDAPGNDWFEVVDDPSGDILEKQAGTRTQTVSVQAFADAAGVGSPRAILSKLRKQTDSVRALTDSLGISVLDISNYRDVSALLADRRETRGNVDVVFSYTQSFEEAGVSVGSVEVNQLAPVADSITVEVDP